MPEQCGLFFVERVVDLKALALLKHLVLNGNISLPRSLHLILGNGYCFFIQLPDVERLLTLALLSLLDT